MSNEGIVLGSLADPLKVVLNGGDFVVEAVAADGDDWPAGAVLTLELGNVNWTTTRQSDTVLLWSVDKAVANTIANDTPARLLYTVGSVDEVWGIGKVVARRG